jgi:hypothetical protein
VLTSEELETGSRRKISAWKAKVSVTDAVAAADRGEGRRSVRPRRASDGNPHCVSTDRRCTRAPASKAAAPPWLRPWWLGGGASLITAVEEAPGYQIRLGKSATSGAPWHRSDEPQPRAAAGTHGGGLGLQIELHGDELHLDRGGVRQDLARRRRWGKGGKEGGGAVRCGSARVGS